MSVPYFAGDITLMFHAGIFAFNMVESSLFVVNQIEELAKFPAGINRQEDSRARLSWSAGSPFPTLESQQMPLSFAMPI